MCVDDVKIDGVIPSVNIGFGGCCLLLLQMYVTCVSCRVHVSLLRSSILLRLHAMRNLDETCTV